MTRRRALTVGVTLTAVLVLAAPAQAGKPGLRPQVTIGALTGPVPGFDGAPEWWLAVDAVDADGVIWEVTVRSGDGLVTWATTGCVQGSAPGTPAHLLIPHGYASPGRYRVVVEAMSLQACPFEGPGGADQESRPVTKVLTVSA